MTTSYLNAHGLNAVEWTLYVGITVLVLALVGLGAAVLGRLTARLGRIAFVTAFASLVCFAFSFPPSDELAGFLRHLKGGHNNAEGHSLELGEGEL